MGATRPLATELLADAFGRVHEGVPSVVVGLAPDDLLWRAGREANPIGWLIWHLTRVQDDHVADLGGVGQVWTTAGWYERFALPYPVSAVGYGQSSIDVGAFVLPDPELLIDYHAATHAMTIGVIESLAEDDYLRVVDDQWDPPVTAVVRLVSVVNDITQHLGQAAYVRGLLDGR
jgi:hypothetical protein